MASKKISSIDIGSNAIRQLIVEVDPLKSDQHWTVLKKFRAPIRLGADVFSTGQISTETLAQVNLAFKEMAKLIKKYKATTSIAVATSALRDCRNQKEVVSSILKNSKVKIKVISGDEEAQLIRYAIFKSQVMNHPETLLIDIGGGSIELTGVINPLDGNYKILFSKSFPLGVVRLLKKSEKQNFKLPAFIKKTVRAETKTLNSKKFTAAIGTGGNFDALAKLKLGLLKKAPPNNITYAELKEIYSLWKTLPLEKKLKLDIRQDRIDVLEIAMTLMLELCDQFKIETIKVPLVGLKEGAIYKAIDDHF